MPDLKMKAYRDRWIKRCTTSKSSILKVFGKYIFPKFTVPITFPGDALLVHHQLLIVEGETIGIIK